MHKKLLAATSKFVTDVVYEADLPDEQARKVLAKLKALSASLPEINFHHDPENRRIILRLIDDPDYA